MTAADTWNQRHATAAAAPTKPCTLLRDRADLLPASGHALDLACGRGGNALYLARRGLQVTACDQSATALELLQQAAQKQDLNIRTLLGDASRALQANYDVITISRYLDRSLTRLITRALYPAGMLFYQTFTRNTRGGPANPAYRLRPNELLALFPPAFFRIVHYREDSLVPPATAQAELIAQCRPAPHFHV